MGTIYLALAFHNHQPVGNFDWVFEEAYRRAYEPMIAALERHPGVRVALHYTGPLRDWLQAHRPELLLRIRRLVARGQVEIMAGAYYEPIRGGDPR
jgi:Alpha-amylase/alpha-mannosidase